MFATPLAKLLQFYLTFHLLLIPARIVINPVADRAFETD